jgi:hypothetical protein
MVPLKSHSIYNVDGLTTVIIYKGAIDKNHTTEHRRISFHVETSFPVQAVPEAVAIKLIGDSFYFHVAYPFKREPKE